jgi:hypothetical protein
MPEWLLKLLESGAVWAALIALMNVLIKYFLPSMPPDILAAVNALVVVILSALGINVSQRVKEYRAARR